MSQIGFKNTALFFVFIAGFFGSVIQAAESQTSERLIDGISAFAPFDLTWLSRNYNLNLNNVKNAYYDAGIFAGHRLVIEFISTQTAKEFHEILITKADLYPGEYLIKYKENCLLFLTKTANFEGISVLLENGANPYYKNKNESALLIALKDKNIYEQNSGNYQFRITREILQHVDYTMMPEIQKYIKDAKEEQLPQKIHQFPIRFRDIFFSRPALLLSFLSKELQDLKLVDQCKKQEPKLYLKAKLKLTPFYYSDKLKYAVSTKYCSR
jgi:hypothetical protein